jgi:hypothetical protein
MDSPKDIRHFARPHLAKQYLGEFDLWLISARALLGGPSEARGELRFTAPTGPRISSGFAVLRRSLKATSVRACAVPRIEFRIVQSVTILTRCMWDSEQ